MRCRRVNLYVHPSQLGQDFTPLNGNTTKLRLYFDKMLRKTLSLWAKLSREHSLCNHLPSHKPRWEYLARCDDAAGLSEGEATIHRQAAFIGNCAVNTCWVLVSFSLVIFFSPPFPLLHYPSLPLSFPPSQPGFLAMWRGRARDRRRERESRWCRCVFVCAASARLRASAGRR